MKTIGLLPAGGEALRIHGLPKFLLPTEDGYLIDRHIHQMRDAGADKIWIAASKTTQPFIKPYVTDATISLTNSATMPEALLAARQTAGDSTVLMGMPDTYLSYEETYGKLLHRINIFGADVAVGLWRIRNDQRGKLGQVDFYGDRCTHIVDKDPACLLPWCWGAIAWRPMFWDFIQPDMPHMGLALQAAIDANVKVWAVLMDGDYYDCGDFASYALMCSRFAGVLTYGG